MTLTIFSPEMARIRAVSPGLAPEWMAFVAGGQGFPFVFFSLSLRAIPGMLPPAYAAN
jgi:hypothetical protein